VSCIPARLPQAFVEGATPARSDQTCAGTPGDDSRCPAVWEEQGVRERLAFIAGADDMMPLRKMGVIATEVPIWNTTGEAAIIGSSSVLAFRQR
jgi:hypothetical protein